MNIMNRIDYDKEMYDILKANDKFKKLKEDPTILQDGQKLYVMPTLYLAQRASKLKPTSPA